MTRPEDSSPDEAGGQFLWLMLALVTLLVAYPYFGNTIRGASLGGLMSLLLLMAGVYAVRTHRVLFLGAFVLAVLAGGADVAVLATGTRGHPFVEGSFAAFYAFTTGCVFYEVMRAREITRNSIYGIVCVYLLLGVAFGTLYDFLETVRPGSFQLNVAAQDPALGWRSFIFYSFMTLTTIGFGDITPATHQAQSLAILEGVIGVLYVAVLIARIVGIYSRRSR